MIGALAPATPAAAAIRTRPCRPASKYIARVLPKPNQIDDLRWMIEHREEIAELRKQAQPFVARAEQLKKEGKLRAAHKELMKAEEILEPVLLRIDRWR